MTAAAHPDLALPVSSEAALEQYLLLLLSDSNLPTGGFVASSGLESWIQHGNLALTADPRASLTGAHPSAASPGQPSSRTRPHAELALLDFTAHSLHSYARFNVPLLCATHRAVSALRHPPPTTAVADGLGIDAALGQVLDADALCECMTLNHVARRASTAQGVALLTLYERALAPELLPPTYRTPDADSSLPSPATDEPGIAAVKELVARYRAAIRMGQGGGKAVEGGNGHMSVSFAVVTAAVGLSLGAAVNLFLFLHARSLLSSAVRLNNVGPYVAHRMLLWDVRALVDEAVAATAAPSDLLPVPAGPPPAPPSDTPTAQTGSDWWDGDPTWAEAWGNADGTGTRGEPVTTWPLGEIIASRHDQLFTRVFNS